MLSDLTVSHWLTDENIHSQNTVSDEASCAQQWRKNVHRS